jgi:RNA polymerase sigma-70 factor (ECF subfamily)
VNARTPDDERLGQLLQAAQSGDADAYLLLLEEITPRVRRLILRRGLVRPEVEDLVQDVLLSVHVARASYDPGRPFLPWLAAIVRNRLADRARLYARRAAHEVLVDDLDVTFSDLVPNTPVEATGSATALTDAIRALPPGQRTAIELLKLNELSLKEAAAATGVSVGALKVATHRAMAALRRLLSVEDADGH